jgi:hypothetical protein
VMIYFKWSKKKKEKSLFFQQKNTFIVFEDQKSLFYAHDKMYNKREQFQNFFQHKLYIACFGCKFWRREQWIKSFHFLFVLFLLWLTYSLGTKTKQAENHPSLSCQNCRLEWSCIQTSCSVLLGSDWRLTYDSSLTNCYDDNECSSSLCPDPNIYSNNCVIDGADYSGTYGITSSVNSLKLVFVTNGPYSTNIGSRV